MQTPTPSHAGIFQNCLIALGSLHSELTQDRYRTNRGFLGYHLYLGKNFLSSLAKLDKDSHWVDGGAGDANAARHYHNSWLWSWLLPKERARVTALGIEEPRSPRTQKFIEASAEDKFRYLHGIPVEKQDLDKLGRADLITDVYGALSYSKEFDEVLTIYGKILKPGGELLAALETGNGFPPSREYQLEK